MAGMGMENPGPQFTYLIRTIRDLYPEFAYLHVLEPRIDGATDRETISVDQLKERDALHALWDPKPLISAGGYDREMGLAVAQKKGQLVAYGRLFISNVSFYNY